VIRALRGRALRNFTADASADFDFASKIFRA
jgi:hypothetical protein